MLEEDELHIVDTRTWKAYKNCKWKKDAFITYEKSRTSLPIPCDRQWPVYWRAGVAVRGEGKVEGQCGGVAVRGAGKVEGQSGGGAVRGVGEGGGIEGRVKLNH